MVTEVLRSIRSLFLGDSGAGFRRRFAAGTLGAYALVIAGNALNLVINVALSRWFGKSGFGAFNFAMACLQVLCIIAGLGVERLLVREVARCLVHQAWGLLHGILRWATKTVGLVSLGLGIAGLIGAWGLKAAGVFEQQSATTFMIALVGLPLFSLSIIRQSAMRGLHRILLGIMPELVLTPVLLLVSLLGLRYLAPVGWLTPQSAMGVNVAVFFVTLVVGIVLLRAVLPKQVRATAPEYRAKAWLLSTVPFTLVSGMFVLNSRPSAIMLGMILGKDAVGAYSAALRGAEIVMFIIIPMNTVLLPTVAHLFASGEHDRLQRVVTAASRGVCAVSGVATIGLVLFGKWFLWLFGKEFMVDWLTLSILCAGQFASTIAAFSANLLTMTGFERDAALGIAVSAVLNVVGNAVLIPLWGVPGAALATSLSLVGGNLYMAATMRRRTGIDATIIGLERRDSVLQPQALNPDE